MPGIAGQVCIRTEADPGTARALAAALVAGAERVRADARGGAAMAHVAHRMPVDQGGIAAAGALLVAACGWVAGDERREGGGGNAAADPAPEVAPFPGRHDAPPTPEPVPHAAPGWTLAQHCLARYLEQGVDGITDLNGSYAVALWDGRRRELYLTQDRFGSAGLYLGIDGDRLLFASRPRALAGRVGAELDAEALGHLLTVGHLLGDRTLFRRIRALGPGEIVIWTDRRLARRSAWTWPRPTDLADTPRRRAAAIEELDAALEAAVADTVAAAGQGVDVVLPLSGGLDSRVLLGYLCRHLEPRTVSYGHRHCRDRRYGARLAQVCGVPHRHVELEPDYMARFGPALVARTEGQASIHAAHLLCLEETVRQRPVLVVSGFFGGTLFGSRRADLLDVVASGNGAAAGNGAVTASDRCEAALRIERGYRVGPGDAELRQLLIPPLAGIATGAAYSAFLDLLGRPVPRARRADLVYIAARQSRFVSYQLQVLGAWAPVRAPFLDHRVIDAALGWPLAWRRRQALYREFVRRRHPALAAVPLTATGVPLAGWKPWRWVRQLVEDCRWQHLRRWSGGRYQPHDYRQYAHYDDWLRDGCRDLFEDLLGEQVLLDGVFDPVAVRQLWQRHLEGRVDAHQTLCAIATVALWRQRFELRSQPWRLGPRVA